MEDLRHFIYFNCLSQVEVANYLGISRGHMSRIVKGESKLSEKNRIKLLQNDRGWDTKFLTDETLSGLQREETQGDEVVKLRAENAQLRQQVTWLQSVVENYLKK